MMKSKLFKTVVTMGLVAACALVLAACQGGSGSGGVAATVNGVEISEKTVTETIQTVRTQSGLDDDDAWAQFLAANGMTPESVREQIINSLIDQELVKQGAAELGVSVDSAEVDDYVSLMRANFDSDEAWEAALKEAGFTEEDYRKSIESSLLQQQVGTYFEEHAEMNDEDVLKAAQTYALYYDGAKRSSHILFMVADTTDEAAMSEARAKAQGVLDQINAGSISFEDAASQYSDDSSKDNGGDVGWDRINTFVTAYQSALDGLNEGEVSGLVETEYGIHIIKCTQVFTAPEEVTSLDQLPEDFQRTIKSMASSISSNDDYNAWLEELRTKADIVINDMPSDVPYNVDMSKYATSGESEAAASDEAASSEAASDEAASSEASEAASDEAASGEASSASAESADGSSESSAGA